MEKITRSGSPTATLEPTAKQPNPFILALLLTSVLYFGFKQTPAKSTVTVPKSAQTAVSLSEPVANAVLQDLSRRSGLPKSALRIVEVEQLNRLEGWHVAIASGHHRWLYHTNMSGSAIELKKYTASPKQQIGVEAIAQG